MAISRTKMLWCRVGSREGQTSQEGEVQAGTEHPVLIPTWSRKKSIANTNTSYLLESKYDFLPFSKKQPVTVLDTFNTTIAHASIMAFIYFSLVMVWFPDIISFLNSRSLDNVWVEYVCLKSHVHPETVNVTLYGNRVFAHVVKVR